MTTTLAVLINDHLLLPCVCDRMAAALGSLAGPTAADTGASDTPTPLHAGVGLHQDGEVLLARRPLLEGQSLYSQFCQSDTNILLAHLEPAGTRSFQTHTMQPYRFKDWLWACSDDLAEAPGFDRQGLAIPGHLRENMRAGTPAETLFHLFLAFLHSAGQLGRLQWNRSALR